MAIAASKLNNDDREMIERDTVTNVSRFPVALRSPQNRGGRVWISCQPLRKRRRAWPSWYDSAREQLNQQLSELAARYCYQQALQTALDFWCGPPIFMAVPRRRLSTVTVPPPSGWSISYRD